MNKIGVTEHIEADECKFALWEGTVAPISDYKLILRVHLRFAFHLTFGLCVSNSGGCGIVWAPGIKDYSRSIS